MPRLASLAGRGNLPSAATERLSPGTNPFLALSNLHRIYLDQLPLLDSPNPKFWLVALIVANKENIGPLMRKVQSYQQSQPKDGIDWTDLLETALIYKLSNFTREEIKKMLNFFRPGLEKNPLLPRGVQRRPSGRRSADAATPAGAQIPPPGPTPPANASRRPMPKPCCCGVNRFIQP